MICKIEKVKVFDFVKSLNIDPIELNDTGSLAYRITDTYHIDTVKAYLNEIGMYRVEIERYSSMEYNLFLSLFEYLDDQEKINNIDDYLYELESVALQDFQHIVLNHFHINGDEIDDMDAYKIVESLTIGDKDKWNLLRIFKGGNETLVEMKKLLERVYPIFNRYENILIERSKNKVRKIKAEAQAHPEDFYQRILKKFLTNEVLKDIDYQCTEQYFTYMNAHVLITNKMNNKRFIAMGIYLPDLMKQREMDELYESERRQRVMKLLADPSRFKILTLIHKGLDSNKMIAETLGITPAGVSYQTNQLTSEELLIHGKAGLKNKLRVNTRLLKDVFDSTLAEFGIINN